MRRHRAYEGHGAPYGAEAPSGAGTPPWHDASPGLIADDAPAPSIQVQRSALQALCRQVIGFRLAMIALGAPFALSRAAGGLAGWLVGGAIIVTVLVSYALLRDWERFGPLLLRHPALLAVDVLLLALLVLTATPNSPVGYAVVSIPMLAGLLYGWRGAGLFTGLQLLVLAAAYSAWSDRLGSPATTLLLAGFCVAAGVVGVTLRNLMFHFGTASQALTEARARIAVGEAVESERARLAREMHDSVAKTLHGLALAADGLAASADHADPRTLRCQAELVARSARRAAAESRELLSGLRHDARAEAVGAGEEAEAGGAAEAQGAQGAYGTGAGGPVGRPELVDLGAEIARSTAEFAARTGLPVLFRPLGEPVPVRRRTARQVLTIAAEAMENAHRHAHASSLTVSAGPVGPDGSEGAGVYRLSVQDDGCGLPPHCGLAELRRTGHFGLLGMVERSAQIGARLRIGRGDAATGTEVRLELALTAITRPPPGDAPYSGLPPPLPPD